MTASRAAELVREKWDGLPVAVQAAFSAMLEAASTAPNWPTLSEAARLLMSDVDDLSLDQARGRIKYAIASGDLIAVGSGTARRIDPGSLAAFRLTTRERELNRLS